MSPRWTPKSEGTKSPDNNKRTLEKIRESRELLKNFSDDQDVVLTTYTGLQYVGKIRISRGVRNAIVGVIILTKEGFVPFSLQRIKTIVHQTPRAEESN